MQQACPQVVTMLLFYKHGKMMYILFNDDIIAEQGLRNATVTFYFDTIPYIRIFNDHIITWIRYENKPKLLAGRVY